ncbi:leucokinin [Drosophila erecta]|uniref:Leucokinin n=1 Tax=Drosophila erecta TaxID=7220 RepID=B3ND36_DROER|nr:leucokinin [Drosophila erecta]EDV51758.1 uncharacterized protein Dere_GG13722 [Drosophila erecta]
MANIVLCILLLVFGRQIYGASVASAPLSGQDPELATCELQLSKYRRFILQAILSFEDVCDAYNSRPGGQEADSEAWLFRHYAPAPTSQRSEIWAFFRLLMAQFGDAEFSPIIRDAVIERCRIKSQLQRDEKRNSVVLGKKQRFHSWGGKRSPEPPILPDY